MWAAYHPWSSTNVAITTANVQSSQRLNRRIDRTWTVAQGPIHPASDGGRMNSGVGPDSSAQDGRINSALRTPACCLLRGQRIARTEGPRSGDIENVGVALDVGWERRIGRGHLDDLLCGEIQKLLAGGTVDRNALHAAVATNAHGEQ